MSGIAGAIGGLFGGNATKTDRKEELSGYGDLSNVFNFGLNNARKEETAGQGLLGQAGGYFSKLLSGNRPAVLQAVAPVVNSANQQADAEKRGIAESGTARGGGVNAVSQQIDTNKNATVDNAVNDAVGGAAKGATAVGGTETADAARLLGISGNSAADLTSLASNSRVTSNALHNQAAANAGVLGDVGLKAIELLFGGGGGDSNNG